MDYAQRYILHGLVWLVTSLTVGAVALIGDSITLYTFGITGNLQAFLAWGIALLTSMYWAHKLACDLVPMGPDGEHFAPPRI